MSRVIISIFPLLLLSCPVAAQEIPQPDDPPFQGTPSGDQGGDNEPTAEIRAPHVDISEGGTLTRISVGSTYEMFGLGQVQKAEGQSEAGDNHVFKMGWGYGEEWSPTAPQFGMSFERNFTEASLAESGAAWEWHLEGMDTNANAFRPLYSYFAKNGSFNLIHFRFDEIGMLSRDEQHLVHFYLNNGRIFYHDVRQSYDVIGQPYAYQKTYNNTEPLPYNVGDGWYFMPGSARIFWDLEVMRQLSVGTGGERYPHLSIGSADAIVSRVNLQFRQAGGYYVNGIQVVGSQQAPIANTGDPKVDQILAVLRNHGLIAASPVTPPTSVSQPAAMTMAVTSARRQLAAEADERPAEISAPGSEKSVAGEATSGRAKEFAANNPVPVKVADTGTFLPNSSGPSGPQDKEVVAWSNLEEFQQRIENEARVQDVAFAGEVEARLLADNGLSERLDGLAGRLDQLHGKLEQLHSGASAGTAFASALTGMAFLPNMSFNMTANIATYEGAHAGAVQVGALLSRHVAVNAGIATGFNRGGKTAARAGMTLGF